MDFARSAAQDVADEAAAKVVELALHFVDICAGSAGGDLLLAVGVDGAFGQLVGGPVVEDVALDGARCDCDYSDAKRLELDAQRLAERPQGGLGGGVEAWRRCG